MTVYFPKKNYSNPLHHLIIPLKIAHSSFISQCAILHLVVSFLVWYFNCVDLKVLYLCVISYWAFFFCLFVCFHFNVPALNDLVSCILCHLVSWVWTKYSSFLWNTRFYFWSFSERISDVRSNFKCQVFGVQQICKVPRM